MVETLLTSKADPWARNRDSQDAFAVCAGMPQHSATASLQCLYALNESARRTLALYGDPHAFAAQASLQSYVPQLPPIEMVRIGPDTVASATHADPSLPRGTSPASLASASAASPDSTPSTAQPADEDIAEAAVSAVACEDIGKAVSVLRAYAGAESDVTSILANACAGRFTAIMHALQKHRPGNPSMRASATPASKGQKRPAPVSASAASQDSTPSTAPPAAALPP